MKALKRFSRLMVSVLVVVFAVPCFPALAEEKQVTMEEVVVTATRDREEVRKIAANVSVITAKEIEASGATTVVEVLEKLEGIDFRSYSGNASQALIDMRGFGGDSPFGKTLIMLDGRRLNRPDMASINWLQIPLSNVERIEVVRGSGSVLYGDSAVAGTINIITKKGVGKPAVTAALTAGSYGLHDERVGVTGSVEKLSYALTGGNQKTSGYRDRSKFSSQSAGLDFGYDASEALNLGLGLSFNNTDYDMPGSLTKSQVEQDRRQAANPNDDSSEKYYNVNLRAESILGALGRFSFNFLYGKKDLTSDMASWSVYSRNNLDTYGLTPKYILEKDILGHRNKLTLGLDYYYETLDQDRYSDKEKTTKTAVVNLARESLGYYVRDEFSILKELILGVGYRTERAEIKGKDVNASTGTTIFDDRKIHMGEAWEAGLTYLIGKKSKVFAKYATLYRYPFLDEQAVYSGWGSDEFLFNLEKEKGRSYEAGTQFYPLDDLAIGLTLFRTDMEDEIVFNSATWKNENLDETRHQGAEFSISYKVEKWFKIYGNYTYHNAEFRNGANSGKEVPLVPRDRVNAGLEIYLPYALTLRPEMRYVSDCFQGGDNTNTAEKVKSYTFYNLYLHYRPQRDRFKPSAFIGVENLTDEKYELISYNGYYPYPGITFKGGVSLTF